MSNLNSFPESLVWLVQRTCVQGFLFNLILNESKESWWGHKTVLKNLKKNLPELMFYFGAK